MDTLIGFIAEIGALPADKQAMLLASFVWAVIIKPLILFGGR